MAFFDLDGCLVDSRAAIAASINHALTTLGHDPRPARALYPYIGPPLRASFVELLGGEQHADHAVEVYRAMYRDRSLVDTVAVPGVAAALAALHGRIPLVVVTTKPRVFAEPIIDAVGLSEYFAEVFAPALDALTETKSETLGQAIEACGLAAAARNGACMVGDRGVDIDAGAAHGLRTIAVTWGIGDEEELTAAGPTHIVSEPQQLPGVVLGTTDERDPWPTV